MTFAEMQVCYDCIAHIACGDVPEDATRAKEVIDACAQFPNLCAGGNHSDDNEFSWTPCACCGSRLGGSRHLALYEEKESNDATV